MRVALYKATRPGFQGMFNRLVRWWTLSPYSHAELVFDNGWCASSSLIDGGVRFKRIELKPGHWDVVDVPGDEVAAMQWFSDHADDKYDVLGLANFVFGPVREDKNKWSCAEAIAAALGVPEPWRQSPAILRITLGERARA